jgi:HD-GYP domain-containing protein (c-di-GMP phosphodiesterase class II)
MVVGSPDELVAAVSRDRRMSGYRVSRQGEGWIELEVIAHRARSPVMVVLAWPETWRDHTAFAPHLTRARSGNYGLILVGSLEEIEDAKLDTVSSDADLTALNSPISMVQLLLALRARAEAIAMRITAATIELEHERARHENEMLISIGRALSQERDIESLLAIILRRACEVTSSDAGSVYIVEGHEEDLTKRRLRFAVSQNESRNVQSAGFTMPVASSSIVGSCVLSGLPINVPDLYKLDQPGVGNNQWGFVHDRGFDDKYQYQGRSVLAVPMISARDEVIGVIQLINKRGKGFISLQDPSDFEQGVVPFDDISEKYVSALASQAGIALENVLLYEEVRSLFDSFVKASVTAIESRDPTTSGHSNRVAELTVSLGRAINDSGDANFRELRFSNDSLKQMEYAALLHDFGKVGVREHVLVKAKKLYEHEREIILQRFQLIKRGHKIASLEKKLQYYQDASREQIVEQLVAVDRDMSSKILELDDIIKFILQANEPTVLEQGGFERIAEIAGMTYDDEAGGAVPLLSHNEAACLQIKRGSLTEAERNEINSHVVHTYNFLKEIPWSRTLRDVPEIAGAHHEKLDGSGYPFGRKAPAIPVEAKMMAIADIYDALTASDRPYKKAMPVEKALDILSGDVKRGQLDAQLFEIFVGARVYLVTQRGTPA